MKGYYAEDQISQRSLDRSPYRNLPEKCLKCAYTSRSGFGMVCCKCMMGKKYKDEI